MTEAITLRSTNKKRNLNAILSVICCVLCLSIFMLGTATVAYCDDVTDEAAAAISTAITEMSTKIYQTMRSIITPLTIIAFAFAGFQFLLGGAQGTEKARKTAIGAGIGLAVVIFAPVFGQAVATWFSSNGQGDLSGYNPLV